MRTFLQTVKFSYPFIFMTLFTLYSNSLEAQIFQDDLVSETMGDFPSRWDLIKGSAEISSLEEGSIIYFANKSIIDLSRLLK